jgi:hypothetical protein
MQPQARTDLNSCDDWKVSLIQSYTTHGKAAHARAQILVRCK